MDVNKSQIQKICKKLKVNLIKFNFLARGNHNENYKIVTKQGNYVLRVENNTYNTLKTEYNFLKKT